MLYACSELRALVPPLGKHDLDIQSAPHVLLSLLLGLHQIIISYETAELAAPVTETVVAIIKYSLECSRKNKTLNSFKFP